ncbi:MAG TPA: hypothetical protein VGF16_21150 [Bryobacteraceae bacterium]
MSLKPGSGILLLFGLTTASLISAQTLSNQSLNGNYYFRHISLGTDVSGNITDARSLLGSITFDGAGHYSFTGQQVVGSGAPAPQTGTGLTYGVDPAGFVSLASPLRSGETVNARYGPEAIVGSTTDSGGSAFDLFIAIPAPTSATSLTSLNGGYWAATLEFPGGSFTNARSTLSNFTSAGAGTLATFTVSGHAANLSSGHPTSQQVTGATYTMATDGTATVNFGTASNTALLSGSRTVYVSADGNILLGGTAGSHDLVIGVKAMAGVTATTWDGRFWSAGLRHDATSAVNYAGTLKTVKGYGKLAWTRRLKILGVGNLDFTGVSAYTINTNGSGASDFAQIALGAAGAAFLGANISANDPNGYEIYFGVQQPAASGTGLWIDPQQVENPTSFSPTGNPICPGDFIRIHASGLPQTTQAATPPYPLSLAGVTVLINNQPAPIYLVTPGTVDFLVPFSVQAPTATVAIQVAGQTSNTVTVPVAATAPGVLTLNQTGSGPGAIQHADYTTVTAAHPASGGEVLQIYLTGLGAVTPTVADGAGSNTSSPSTTAQQPVVLIAGQPATVLYSGLTIYPGLYQINVLMPPVPPGATTALPLAISTTNAFHDQVDIPIQ